MWGTPYFLFQKALERHIFNNTVRLFMMQTIAIEIEKETKTPLKKINVIRLNYFGHIKVKPLKKIRFQRGAPRTYVFLLYCIYVP